jgi:UDP-N-acetylmuramyl tripeptide synthase
MDRREAIRESIRLAKLAQVDNKTIVLITGKGTDPYIMRKGGVKEPWSDALVAKEELTKQS